MIESGRDYDSAVEVAAALVRDRGMELAHSTNDRRVIAGAGTLSAELFEQAAAQSAELHALEQHGAEAGMIEAGEQRRLLAEIAGQRQHLHVKRCCRQRARNLQRVVT